MRLRKKRAEPVEPVEAVEPAEVVQAEPVLSVGPIAQLVRDSVLPAVPYTTDRLDLLSSEVKMVTPELAANLRRDCHFERQRPISPRNVERLAAEMRKGWFIAGTPIFMCVLPNGERLLVNGNHTLEAIALSGVNVPLTFVYSRVQSIAEASLIYACLDLQKTRSWGDALRAGGLDDQIPMLRSVSASVGIIMAGFRENHLPESTSRKARLDRIPEYADAAALIAEIWKKAPVGNQRILKRGPFFAVVLETARYQPSAAEEFWRETCADNGLVTGHPGKALLRFGINHPTPAGGARLDHCRAAAQAWNAYFERRSLDVCRPGKNFEFRILGTPFHRAGKIQRMTPAGALEEVDNTDAPIVTEMMPTAETGDDQEASVMGPPVPGDLAASPSVA